MAQRRHGVTVIAIVDSILTLGNEILLINYFYFFVLAPTQKPGDEFRHSIHNASKKLVDSGERSGLTLGSLCSVRDTE